MDMAYTSMMNGIAKSISSGKSEDYVTRIDIVLPANYNDIACKPYKVKYKDYIIDVFIKLIEEKEQDPILKAGGNFQYGTSNESGLPEMLPFEVFTDNKGIYPAILASIVFPFRLATWVDNNHETGMKMDHDYDAIQVTGFPDNNEKIQAIIVLNKLFELLTISKKHKLKYEDITAFLEIYFEKNNSKPILSKINTLSSKVAYKNAIQDYYLKNIDKSKINLSLEKIKSSFESTVIENENDLLCIVNKTIEDFLIHNIEHRRWIEPFWDGERKIKIDGNEVIVPRTPKSEPKIQPTLHVILDMALRPLGIHVLRESDEGIGLLDFRFLYTNKKNIPLSIGVEFKIAHHQKIQHGLTKQLPAYLKAIRSTHGTFIVMWFKDEKYFKRPKNRQLKQMTTWLKDEAIALSEESKNSISTMTIDASIRPSASNI